MRRHLSVSLVTLVVSVAACVTLEGEAAAAPQTEDTSTLVSELRKDAKHAALLDGALKKAEDALSRARSMDKAGDTKHAAAARATAREWTECAKDLVRVADAEAKAVETERAVEDLETNTTRQRALLEETIARRGRAAALLAEQEREAKAPAPDAPPKKAPKAKAAPRPAAPAVNE